jgi:hypothetical protein
MTLQGSLAGIAGELPNGFHDAEVRTFDVDWRAEQITITGVAWVAEDGPPELYRCFKLTVDGLRSLSFPAASGLDEGALRISVPMGQGLRCDGFEGWPEGRRPVEPPFPDAWVYSFFFTAWNDFVTMQAYEATLEWLGDAYAAS